MLLVETRLREKHVFFRMDMCSLEHTRQKRTQLSSVKAHSKQLRSLVLSNARARDAKLVLSSKTLTKYQALSDLLRSLIVSSVPRQMLSIA